MNKKNVLIKNISILLIFGGLSKIVGSIGKIIFTRIAGLKVISIYSIIIPTFMLIVTLSQFSMPISISKITSEEKYRNTDILFNSLLISLIVNIIIILITLVSSTLIATTLHDKNLSAIIECITLTIPFVSITSIQRGFLHGKEDMFLSTLTSVFEEVIKIILIVTLIPIFISISNYHAVIGTILFNIILELSTIIILHIRIKNKYIQNKKYKLNYSLIKDILSISVPTTFIRLISAIGLFIEPIILTNTLIQTGYIDSYIKTNYGIINSYIIPLLSIPSFFSASLASALLPNITKLYSNKKYEDFKRKVFNITVITLIISIIFATIILLFPSYLLKLIYNTNIGINYVYVLGPVFILLYLQPILVSVVQASGNVNKLFIISIINVILKYSFLYLLGINNYGINSYVYSIILGIITTTLLLMCLTYKIIRNPA